MRIDWIGSSGVSHDVIQADLLDLPFQASFTLAYSIGVLHHLPDPKAGFLAVASHVRPGGRICAWVYGREGNEWIVRFVDPVRKGVTSRAPRAVTRELSFPLALILYAALKLLYPPSPQPESAETSPSLLGLSLLDLRLYVCRKFLECLRSARRSNRLLSPSGRNH